MLAEWRLALSMTEGRRIMEKQKRNMLIIDDEEVNRRLLKSYFEDEYNVIEAVDGKQGIEKLQQYNMEISIILLDIIMPNIDGFEVLKFLNNYGYIGEIPVILITADTTMGREEQAFDLGVSDFIYKPQTSHINFSYAP